MAKKKEITTEDLAKLVELGFKKQDARLDEKIELGFKKQDARIEERFRKQDAKFDKKIEDLAGMVKRGFDNVEERLNQIDVRFDKLENIIMEDYGPRIRSLEFEVHKLKKILALE